MAMIEALRLAATLVLTHSDEATSSFMSSKNLRYFPASPILMRAA